MFRGSSHTHRDASKVNTDEIAQLKRLRRPSHASGWRESTREGEREHRKEEREKGKEPKIAGIH